jgi:hypothetical protein
MKIALSCIASEDYLEKYKKCVDSQRSYCEKYRYDYYLNSDTTDIAHWKDWYWKKIHEALQLLEKYDFVVIIDADCEITESAVNIESELDDNSIYYVLGISNRPNSGFLIIRNDRRGIDFLTDLLEKRHQTLPEQYRSTKGENGHVIWCLGNDSSKTKELNLKWNCSQPEHINDAYIIHYTNKMRQHYEVAQ